MRRLEMQERKKKQNKQRPRVKPAAARAQVHLGCLYIKANMKKRVEARPVITGIRPYARYQATSDRA